VRHCIIDPSKVGTVIKVSKVYETPSWVLTVTPSIIVHCAHTQDFRGPKDRKKKELGVFVAKGKAINLEL
jgi:hypothetical protein